MAILGTRNQLTRASEVVKICFDSVDQYKGDYIVID